MATNPQPLGGNEMPRFGGIATFMRLPATTPPNELEEFKREIRSWGTVSSA